MIDLSNAEQYVRRGIPRVVVNHCNVLNPCEAELAGDFVGRETAMGGIGWVFGSLGRATGYVAGVATKGVGEFVGFVADKAGAPGVAQTTRDIAYGVGDFVDKAANGAGTVAGWVAEKAVIMSAKAGGAVGESITRMAGGDESAAKTGRLAGSVVCGAAVGLVVGQAVGGAVASVAAMGTASTGAAISGLSGAAATNATLAAIGGGALAAGGGGMAAGQAVLTGIGAASAAVGGVDGASANRKRS